jgi:hypothetical protein
MTGLKDPKSAKVFVVGYNPVTPYMAYAVNYERFIDSLFNRNGEDCGGFYAEYRRSRGERLKKTPARGNIEWFSEKLRRTGTDAIIETNVVCYGGSKESMSLPEHKGGKERGIEIFRILVAEIRPKVIIVHSKGASDEFNRNFRETFGFISDPPRTGDEIAQVKLKIGPHAFVISPLGRPGYSNWPRRAPFCHWADDYLDKVAHRVAQICAA